MTHPDDQREQAVYSLESSSGSTGSPPQIRVASCLIVSGYNIHPPSLHDLMDFNVDGAKSLSNR